MTVLRNMRAYRRAEDYPLDSLEFLIRIGSDDYIRRAYVQSWIDRATDLANGSGADAEEWKQKLDRNRRRWLGLYEDICCLCEEPFTPTEVGQVLRQAPLDYARDRQDRLLCPECLKAERREWETGRENRIAHVEALANVPIPYEVQ